MLNAPSDTLAFHKQRALTTMRSMATVPCSHVASRIKQCVDTGGIAIPEQEALWFYMMNHGMSEIGKQYADLEPLPHDVLQFVNSYYTEGARKALRAMSYLMLITVREARHLHNKDEIKSGMVEASCYAAWDYLGTIPDNAQTAQQLFAKSPPKCDVVSFVKGISWQFYKGSYSGGYGGPKWGNVADCLLHFVQGTATAEVMLDTIWTLCHNGGPIFNKGVLYQHHSNKLLRVLDVQRGGMIPQMIATDNEVKGWVDQDLATKTTWLRSRFPETTNGSVDWLRVKALGAVGHYPNEIKKQQMSDPQFAAKEAEAAAKEAAQKKMADMAKAEKKKATQYQVDWNTVVPKFMRSAQASGAL